MVANGPLVEESGRVLSRLVGCGVSILMLILRTGLGYLNGWEVGEESNVRERRASMVFDSIHHLHRECLGGTSPAIGGKALETLEVGGASRCGC